ncbi:MAG TPA: anaerobic C4-dicarboxylate transporter [Candidatus Faecousia faecavium]|nr:anaerobic C4-dicarboxylate transporter [Candidatus Faecousia faecavium]
MFWIELVILLVLIAWGVRKGSVFLTLAGGFGAFIFTFLFKAPMSDPPMTVLRIIMCVVIAGGAMQAAGGIEYLVALAEKIMRKYPKSITIVAPLVSWVFVFCCGTGHILWSLLPIINEIAIENGIRPERPIAASVVSSQNAVCGTPLAAATAALVGFLEASGSVDMIKVLMVVIPATLLGSLASGIVMLKKGKELADDPEFQARVANGTLVLKEHKGATVDTSKFSKQSKISVVTFLVAMVVIVLLGVVKSLRPVLSNGNALGMTDIIQIFMLMAAGVICMVMDKKPDAILDSPVFRSGVFAAVITLGLCWMVNIFIGAQSSYLTEVVSQFTNKYPWVFIIACYLVGNITTSQGSTTAIVIPLGLALGISTPVLLAGWVVIGSHFLIPAASESLAAIAFDTAGTTKIGKFVFNTSYLLPSVVMAVVDSAVAFVLASIII